MEEKKRIGFLTLVIVIAGIILAVIDAVVSVSYGVVPPEPPADTSVYGLAMNGPVWWKINPIIVITVISVGVIAFLIGSDLKLFANRIKSFYAFLRVALTFVIMSFSGIGDIISQTFIEYLKGNSPLNWLYIDWWWTKFMPLPAALAFLMGHELPSGIDMAIASILGTVLLSVMWLHYYGKINFTKIRAKVLFQ